LYTLLAVCVYCYSNYYASQQTDYEHSENWYALFIAAIFFICVLMSAAAGALVTNGCIRYILNSDRAEKNKKWYILLTFIPIINVIYGVICLKKISKKVLQLQIVNK
ncbi:MAG: hypothetical protein K2G04_10375, partial [Oscillospiraceae bacterium]|nr:hypothetical protein [Oscillospiraceae bacterium]